MTRYVTAEWDIQWRRVQGWPSTCWFPSAKGRGRLVVNGDLYAQSSFYYTNAAATILPETLLPSYHLLNARVELNEIEGSKVSASAYIRTATQEHYYTGGFGLGAVIGINSSLPGVPRMFGLEVSAKF